MYLTNNLLIHPELKLHIQTSLTRVDICFFYKRNTSMSIIISKVLFFLFQTTDQTLNYNLCYQTILTEVMGSYTE